MLICAVCVCRGVVEVVALLGFIQRGFYCSSAVWAIVDKVAAAIKDNYVVVIFMRYRSATDPCVPDTRLAPFASHTPPQLPDSSPPADSTPAVSPAPGLVLAISQSHLSLGHAYVLYIWAYALAAYGLKCLPHSRLR